MKTVEELEAQLEGAKMMVDSLTRSLELAEAELAVVRKELRATRNERNEWRNLAETRGAILGDMTP
jgi:uncharacterized protein (DUF3084 family)